ncbi:MAG: hypothetical protein V2I67_06550 [Thermoanaerobaculales bacterium]|nr:hypothetical protein [Thermoanaerobaculales bacterium]
MIRDDPPVCAEGWEALCGDSLPWLLDETRPNLLWRVLVELVGRPTDSPAVRRARSGANACSPVADLLKDLQPDGSWSSDSSFWADHRGPGWRLLAAVQWGADPEDPRLHAASERLLLEAPGEGGLAEKAGAESDVVVTARTLEAMADLGWCRHARVQEWLAWFEATEVWEDDPSAAVAVLRAGAACDRSGLRDRAVAALDQRLICSGGNNLTTLGHPNFHRTDLAEIFAAFVEVGVPYRDGWDRILAKLQRVQDSKGRWDRVSSVPKMLGLPGSHEPSHWITLKATRALLTYAVEARLPRAFPLPPG